MIAEVRTIIGNVIFKQQEIAQAVIETIIRSEQEYLFTSSLEYHNQRTALFGFFSRDG